MVDWQTEQMYGAESQRDMEERKTKLLGRVDGDHNEIPAEEQSRRAKGKGPKFDLQS